MPVVLSRFTILEFSLIVGRNSLVRRKVVVYFQIRAKIRDKKAELSISFQERALEN